MEHEGRETVNGRKKCATWTPPPTLSPSIRVRSSLSDTPRFPSSTALSLSLLQISPPAIPFSLLRLSRQFFPPSWAVLSRPMTREVQRSLLFLPAEPGMGTRGGVRVGGKRGEIIKHPTRTCSKIFTTIVYF